ncbi:MAG: DinB family protein [Bryobacterales bacterium]|nr:DinB family protein [Bryobacterales bacterium]
MTEPWLSGSLTHLHPVPRAVLHCFEQARADLAHWTEGLSPEQLWARPFGLGPAGFHIRHAARSIDRLFTYAQGRLLDEAQMSALAAEMDAGASREELLDELGRVLGRVSEQLRALDPAALQESRGVGRKQLPTTVTGLLIHIAEHTQRHVGEAIVTVRVLKAL